MGDHAILKGVVIGSFNYDEENSYLKILMGRFWEKRSGRGCLVALRSYWPLKKGTRTVNVHSNEFSHNIKGP